MRAGIRRDRLPMRRVVVQLEFTGERTGTFWLLLTREDVSVCLQPSGFDVDLEVRAAIAAFYQVWIGRIALAAATHAGRLEIDGLPSLARAFPSWLALSPFAPAVRAAGGGRFAP